jgi:hypothetical protein
MKKRGKSKRTNESVSIHQIKNELDLRSPSDLRHILKAWSMFIEDTVLIQDKQYKYGILGTLKIVPSNVSSLRTKNHYAAMTEGITTVIHNNHSSGWVFRTKWDKLGSINAKKTASNTNTFSTTRHYRFRFCRDIRRRLYHLIKGGKSYV